MALVSPRSRTLHLNVPQVRQRALLGSVLLHSPPRQSRESLRTTAMRGQYVDRPSWHLYGLGTVSVALLVVIGLLLTPSARSLERSSHETLVYFTVRGMHGSGHSYARHTNAKGYVEITERLHWRQIKTRRKTWRLRLKQGTPVYVVAPISGFYHGAVIEKDPTGAITSTCAVSFRYERAKAAVRVPVALVSSSPEVVAGHPVIIAFLGIKVPKRQSKCALKNDGSFRYPADRTPFIPLSRFLAYLRSIFHVGSTVRYPDGHLSYHYKARIPIRRTSRPPR
jgi:hypothetical protein